MSEEGVELELLLAISDEMKGDKQVHAIGPVYFDDKTKRYRCPLSVAESFSAEKYLTEGYMIVETKQGRQSVELPTTESPGLALFACPGETGDVAADPAPNGRLKGGHPIWHGSSPADWGTVAFTAESIRVKRPDGRELNADNAALCCNHIIALGDDADPGDAVGNDSKTGRLSGSFPINQQPIVDLALAEFDRRDVNKRAQIEVVGELGGVAELPGLRGVGVHQNTFIKKFGWRSKLTAGLDLGWTALNSLYAQPIFARKTTPGFACCHDSGSAVLDARNNIVGVVIAGEALPCDARPSAYFIPCIPWDQPAVTSNLMFSWFWLGFETR